MASNIQAVIFDMDGVLVDSEPFWQQAELEVFGHLGLQLSDTDPLKTQGLTIEEVVEYWYQRFPWDKPDRHQVAREILDVVSQKILAQGQPLPGVYKAIEQIQQAGIPMALATSSSSPLIQALLKKLGLTDAFMAKISAETLPFGKPHPELYLIACSALGVLPENCLAIEDSLNGIVAAKAAKMKVVAIPDGYHQTDPRFAIADQKLNSLEEFELAKWLH